MPTAQNGSHGRSSLRVGPIWIYAYIAYTVHQGQTTEWSAIVREICYNLPHYKGLLPQKTHKDWAHQSYTYLVRKSRPETLLAHTSTKKLSDRSVHCTCLEHFCSNNAASALGNVNSTDKSRLATWDLHPLSLSVIPIRLNNLRSILKSPLRFPSG